MQSVPLRHSQRSPLAIDDFSRRYRELLSPSDDPSLESFPKLLEQLSTLLHEVVSFSCLFYALREGATNATQVYFVGVESLAEGPSELLMDGSPFEWVWNHKSPLLIDALETDQRFSPAFSFSKAKGLHSLVVLPIGGPHDRLGALGFAAGGLLQVDKEGLHFLEQIAALVGLVVNNLLSRETVAGEQAQIRELTELSTTLSRRGTEARDAMQLQRSQLETIVEINTALAATRMDLSQIFPAISTCFAKVVPHDDAVISLWDEEHRRYTVYSNAKENGRNYAPEGMNVEYDNAFASGLLQQHAQGAIVRRRELEYAAERFKMVRRTLDAGVVSWCMVPMRVAETLVGIFYLGSRREDAFAHRDLQLVQQVAHSLALFMQNAVTHKSLQREKEDLEKVLEVGQVLTSILEPAKLYREVSKSIRSVLQQDCAYVVINDGEDKLRFYLPDSGAEGILSPDERIGVSEAPAGLALRKQETISFSRDWQQCTQKLRMGC